ncbi:MAG: hypothetical protein AAB131_06520 [Actinomycetota bacterium]
MASAILLSTGRDLSLVGVFAEGPAAEQVSLVAGYVDADSWPALSCRVVSAIATTAASTVPRFMSA